MAMVFIISAPTGTGKSSLVKKLLKIQPNLTLSVSYTTRQPRKGETNGVEYNFVDFHHFEQLKHSNDLLESNLVYGNWYGTSKSWIQMQLNSGKDVLLEIDYKGAIDVKKNLDDAVMIFILPPSLEELRNRLINRSLDSREIINRRLSSVPSEIRAIDQYDYILVNDDFHETLDSLSSIISVSSLTCSRQCKKLAPLIEELSSVPIRTMHPDLKSS